MDKLSLAIDMGGSKFLVGFVDSRGKILCQKRYLWSSLDKDTVMADVIGAVRQLMAEYPFYKASAVGATIPGLADPEKGIWVESSFSGIRDLNVSEILSRELGLPAFIDNDSNACALAERIFGVCKGCPDFFWMTVSNGIGGAMYIKDEIYLGGFKNAGEIGHLIVCEENGRPCKCGSVGCLEVHAAGPAIAKNYMELGGKDTIDGVAVNAKSIAELARKGDRAALSAYDLEGYYLGKAIAALANIVNPQKVVIGGGVSLAFDLFEEKMNKTFQKMVYSYANKDVKIERTGLGYEAALIGAGALAFRGIKLL